MRNAPTVSVSTETEVAKRILAALEHEPRVNLHRHPIRIEIENEVATLEGEVDSVAAKKLALGIAAATAGIVGIVDRLRVSRSTRMTDGEIQNHLRDAWLQEPAFRDVTLLIESDGQREAIRKARGRPYAFLMGSVEEGIVTLNGQLGSLSHKRLAGLLAWWIPGTRDVVNGIEVVPDEIDSDHEITDAVRLALEKDRLVDEGRIGVSTRDRVVTLEGTVGSDRVREMAELDSWYVFGVDGVVNRLELSPTIG